MPPDSNARPVILTFADWYLPGFRAGGPLRSISNLVRTFGSEFEFRIVTRDHDLGVATPYLEAKPGTWIAVGGAKVLYLTPYETNPWSIGRLIRTIPHEALYLNSLFSPHFAVLPLIISRIMRQKQRVMIAPRGELFSGALAIKPYRKALYLRIAKLLGLYDRVLFHASSEDEREAVLTAFEHEEVVVSPVLVAPDLVYTSPAVAVTPGKKADVLRIVTVARIARNKNIQGAIEMLSQLDGQVLFDIYGPCEDVNYWHVCREQIARLPANVIVMHRGTLPPSEITATIGNYDAFLLPTHGENFGHSIIEALQAGRPVVISDCTPWSDVERWRAGWALSLDDPKEFTKVLQGLVRMNFEQHAEWVDGAQRYAANALLQNDAVHMNRSLLQSATATEAK